MFVLTLTFWKITMSVAVFESLESRRLLASSAWDIQIDFQPPTTPDVPAGYRADVGGTYGRRRSGLTYGWNDSHDADGRQRDSDESQDQRYDTFIHLGGNDWWGIAVPNGRYVVRVVAGEPDNTDSNYKIDVEGKRVIDARPRNLNPWVEGAVEVVVEDGQITMTSAAGAENNKVAFIEIRSVKPGEDTIEWKADGAPDAPLGRSETGVIQVGRRLFLMGGYIDGDYNVTRSMDVFNLQTQTWSQGTPLPADAGKTHMGLATDGTYIYLVSGQPGGGFGAGTVKTFKYDIAAATWERWLDLPQDQPAGALTYLDGALYYFGGVAADRATPLADHWAISTRSRNPQWVPRAALPEAGDHLSRAIVDGKIFAIGGEEGHAGIDFHPPSTHVQHNFLFAYDPATDVWTRKADLPIASSHNEGSTFVVGSRIFSLAGMIGLDRQSASVRVYDTLTDEWDVLPDLPDARIESAAGLWGGRIFFTAGYSPKFGFATQSYIGTLGTVPDLVIISR